MPPSRKTGCNAVFSLHLGVATMLPDSSEGMVALHDATPEKRKTHPCTG